jgi:GT2 family glycosyltransferase
MDVDDMKPLIIIPTYITNAKSVELTFRCLSSIMATARGEVEILAVDDASPAVRLRQKLIDATAHFVTWEIKKENTGFSKTVNLGLAQALSEGRDAILCNADIEFFEPGWVKAMLNTNAYVVGSLLFFPNGLIQHGGVYYSALHRTFDHIWRYAPGNIPEAQIPRRCPVTAALHMIRNESLALIGLYDENFAMAYEDVDYCLRVFEAGRQCIYQPKIRAVHHEKMFRGTNDPNSKLAKWHNESEKHFIRKWAAKDFADSTPMMLSTADGAVE